MISCRVAALTVLLSTASTLTLARTEELPKEEARSEEVDVEASEEAVSIESTASAEALAFVQATTMPEDDEWHFIVAPYLWLVDTSITMRIGPIVQEVDVPFDAVLSQLKGAFVIHFEANKKRWGAVTDFQYVSAAKGGALQIPRPDGSFASGDFGIKLLFWETWPYYRFGEGRNVFDLIGGIRYYRVSNELDFSQIGGPTQDLSFDWVDPIVGGALDRSSEPQSAFDCSGGLRRFRRRGQPDDKPSGWRRGYLEREDASRLSVPVDGHRFLHARGRPSQQGFSRVRRHIARFAHRIWPRVLVTWPREGLWCTNRSSLRQPLRPLLDT